MSTITPDAAPANKPVVIQLTVIPDVAPTNIAPDAAPKRVVRTFNEQPHWHHGLALIAFNCILYGLIITPSVWFGAYIPLKHKVERMNNLGPLSCNFTSIGLDKGSCCDHNKYCNTYGTALYTTWSLNYNGGIIRVGPKVANVCPDTNLTMVIEQMTIVWSSHHICYLDPKDDDQVSMDLVDLRASTSHTSARFVASMFFFTSMLLGCVILVILWFIS